MSVTTDSIVVVNRFQKYVSRTVSDSQHGNIGCQNMVLDSIARPHFIKFLWKCFEYEPAGCENQNLQLLINITEYVQLTDSELLWIVAKGSDVTLEKCENVVE